LDVGADFRTAKDKTFVQGWFSHMITAVFDELDSFPDLKLSKVDTRDIRTTTDCRQKTDDVFRVSFHNSSGQIKHHL
jgi:hypothetical protein